MEVNHLRNEVLENKKAVVAEIQEKVNNSASSIIVEYHGLNVVQITELRRQLRAEGIDFKVYKNKLFQRAVEGTDFEALTENLVGPNAVAFGDDAVAPARVLAQFAKKNKTSHRSKEHWEVSLFYMIQPIPSFSPRLMEFFNF